MKREEKAKEVLGTLPVSPQRDRMALWLRIAHLWYLLGHHTKFLELAMGPMVESLQARANPNPYPSP